MGRKEDKTRFIILGLMILMAVYPLALMISGSFQNVQFLTKQPPDIIPIKPTLWNYGALLEDKPVVLWMLNTLWIGGITCVLGVSTTMIAAYGMYTAHRAIGATMIGLCFAYITISKTTLMIPTYVVMARLKLLSRLGLILSSTLMPMGIIIASNYLKTVPKEIIESAKIDGAGMWQVFRKIILSLSKPIIAMLFIFKGIEMISDYVWQHLFLREEMHKTWVVGLVTAMQSLGYAGQTRKDPIGPSLASSTLMLIPVLAVFLIFQRYFIKGIMEGGLK